MNRVFTLGLAALCSAASACTTNYRPSEVSPSPRMERDDAELALIRTLKEAETDSSHYEEILAGGLNFQFRHKSSVYNTDRLGNCPYSGTPAPVVAHYTNPNVSSHSTIALGGCADRGASGVGWDGYENESADRFADAWFVLANSPPPDPAQDPEFQKAVGQYHAAGARPVVGEEVRAHRVGAEAAVKEKRFEDAVKEYDEALKLAPWWPQGHFNRALILAELGAYGAATRGMKRYLLLEPDAENARQVQDKIYAWQAKVK